MEQSLSSLCFKGLIPEAIYEAKLQKKLFVVYISGEDEKSVEMESSTWRSHNVSESVLKYCILLHVQEGSPDAINFSKIYPQNSVPCITAVGFNGVKLWQMEGYIAAEALASSLEKAWLSLHIQETTANVLTAALAAQKPEPPISEASRVTSATDQGSSSITAAAHRTDVRDGDSKVEPSSLSKKTEEKEGSGETVGTKISDETSSRSKAAIDAENSTTKEARLPKPQSADLKIPGEDPKMTSNSEGHHTRGADKECLSEIEEGPELNFSNSNATLADRKPARIEERSEAPVDTNHNRNVSSDVHLNIRLPSGVSLQDKFTLTSTLGMVKDYVDKNHSGELQSYDLAIPYPRKIFNDQDLSKSLLDLELCGRQALIVVPRARAKNYGGVPSLYNSTTNSSVDSSSGSIGGYFGLVRKLLSYMNPFSYLGGSSQSSTSEQDSDPQQYRPYTALQDNSRRMERPFSQDSVNRDMSTAGTSQVTSRKPASSQFGSNIHTLKHDEDDRFSDRNQFWNGNSTQYGGNGNEK